MRKMANDYPDFKFVQEVLAQITWYHNIILIDKVKDKFTAEYSQKYINKPIGVSEYKLLKDIFTFAASYN